MLIHQSERDDAEIDKSFGAFHNRLLDLDKLKHQGSWGERELKITGETPEIRSDKRKPREDRQNHISHRYHGSHR